MKRRHHLDAFVVMKTASRPGDALARVQQILHRCVAEHDDYLRLRNRNLAFEKWFTRCRLVRHWRAIAGWAATVDVANQHFFTFQTDSFDDLSKQLARPPDERPCLHVFVRARSFADKHQPGLAVALGVDHVRALEMKRTASAVANFRVNLFESFT